MRRKLLIVRLHVHGAVQLFAKFSMRSVGFVGCDLEAPAAFGKRLSIRKALVYVGASLQHDFTSLQQRFSVGREGAHRSLSRR